MIRGALMLCLLALTAACGRNEAAVPRPKAYPRIEIPDSVYNVFSGPFAAFEFNASCDTVQSSKTALDVLYGPLNARLYTSQQQFKASENLTEAIANRNTRISLNLGGSQARTSTFVNEAGFECRIVTALDPVPTPVQFYCVSGDGRFVSGAAVFSDVSGSADSIAPAVRALERDVIRLAGSLR